MEREEIDEVAKKGREAFKIGSSTRQQQKQEADHSLAYAELYFTLVSLPGARAYFEPLTQLAHSLDPAHRPITFANLMQATYKTDTISDIFDVLCLNRYFGWYTYTGDLESAGKALQEELDGWVAKYPTKPIIVSEYGADTMAGLHSVLRLIWSEEFQIESLDVYHGVFDKIQNVVGEHVWNFADFQTKECIQRVDGNKKGVFTRDRRPKGAAFALRKRWTNITSS
ncbi:glycoside hydrolase superfamily [Aspergillus desertorum]